MVIRFSLNGKKKYKSDAFPTFAFTNEYFKIYFDNIINKIFCTTRSKSISIVLTEICEFLSQPVKAIVKNESTI